MRKIIFVAGTTVNGYDAGGWIPEDTFARPDLQEALWTQLSSIDTFIMGRVTYQVWFEAWPPLRGSTSPLDAKFSAFADDVEKIVVSNTLTASEWKNSRIIGGDIHSKLSALKQQPGSNLAIVGGAGVARTIGKLGLIDEYLLWTWPTIVGSGESPFDTPAQAVDLELVEAKTFGSGLLMTRYAHRK